MYQDLQALYEAAARRARHPFYNVPVQTSIDFQYPVMRPKKRKLKEVQLALDQIGQGEDVLF